MLYQAVAAFTSSGRGSHVAMMLSQYPILSMQANTRLEQAIRSREAAANYPALVDSVLTLVADLNGELKKVAFA